jgi:hypothetical protein
MHTIPPPKTIVSLVLDCSDHVMPPLSARHSDFHQVQTALQIIAFSKYQKPFSHHHLKSSRNFEEEKLAPLKLSYLKNFGIQY